MMVGFSFKAGKYFQTAGTAEPGVQVSPRCPEAEHMLLSVEPWRDAAQEPLGIKQGSCAADVGYRWAKGKYERFAALIAAEGLEAPSGHCEAYAPLASCANPPRPAKFK